MHGLVAEITYLLFFTIAKSTDVPVIKLTDQNINKVLNSNDAVLLNFYTTWCYYSNEFRPIFEETGLALGQKFPADPKVVAGSVDCVDQRTIERRFGINKYPSIKLVLHGRVLDNEFRGGRNVESLVKYVSDQLEDALITLRTVEDWGQIYTNMPAIITRISQQNNAVHRVVQNVAQWLRNSCKFYVTFDGLYLPVIFDASQDHVYLKAEDDDFKNTQNLRENEFRGNMTDQEALYQWAVERCKPSIQELTFENAEELTEPGIPFLVLFRHPNDYKSLETFRNAVKRELVNVSAKNIRPLVADGNTFNHPLHLLGKSSDDLPIVILDTFVHSYVMKFKNLNVPSKLKKFWEQHESGKLHDDYHNFEEDDQIDDDDEDDDENVNNDDDKNNEYNDNKNGKNNNDIFVVSQMSTIIPDKTTTKEIAREEMALPAKSAFKNLLPSRFRYSLKHEEL